MTTTNKSRYLLPTALLQAQETDPEATADTSRKDTPRDRVLLAVILEDTVMKAPAAAADAVKTATMQAATNITMTAAAETLETKAARDATVKTTAADIETTNKAAESTTWTTIQTERTISSEETTRPDGRDRPRKNGHRLATDTHRLPPPEDTIGRRDTATEVANERETDQEKRAAAIEIDEEVTDAEK